MLQNDIVWAGVCYVGAVEGGCNSIRLRRRQTEWGSIAGSPCLLIGTVPWHISPEMPGIVFLHHNLFYDIKHCWEPARSSNKLPILYSTGDATVSLDFIMAGAGCTRQLVIIFCTAKLCHIAASHRFLQNQINWKSGLHCYWLFRWKYSVKTKGAADIPNYCNG